MCYAPERSVSVSVSDDFQGLKNGEIYNYYKRYTGKEDRQNSKNHITILN